MSEYLVQKKNLVYHFREQIYLDEIAYVWILPSVHAGSRILYAVIPAQSVK
jgi:hypothetical protein